MTQYLTRLANSIMRVYLATPKPLRWIYWLLPIIYFLMPIDLDGLGWFGRIDDILIMVFSYWAFDRAKKFEGFYKESRSGARQQEPPEDVNPQEQNPYQILGVSETASRAEIKGAYRRLIAMYHPDKFAHLGADFEATAQSRSRAIIHAYQQLTGR